MFFAAPFKIGPFSVDPEGRLSPCDPAAAPAFLFRWHDRVVRARLRPRRMQTPMVGGWLSRQPSRAEQHGRCLRRDPASALLRAAALARKDGAADLAAESSGGPSRVAGARYAN